MTARSFILLLCGAIAPNAIAQVTIDTSAQYKIRNYHSGLVLSIDGASQTAGTNAVQWTDNSSQEQYWHFVPEGNRQYLIENMNSHQVLGIANASTTPGALALQWADNGTPDHLWQAMDAGGGLYKLRNVHSGLVLGIRDASTDSGALALQWNDNGTSDHLWSFEPAGQAYADPAAVSVSYDMGDRAWIHDPSMTNAAGTYHLYSTHGGIHVHSSSDRINFTDDGQALPFVPSWAYNYTPSGDLWAPDISYRNGQYWLYYAASRFGSSHSAIGLATSATAEPWSFADSGDAVLTSAQCPGSNAIDPGITLDDSGTPWMVFGSWSGGIYIVQIDSDTGQVGSGASCIHLASRTSGRAIEGAYIYRHNGYYYLFVSLDVCCQGINSTYHIAVGRATTITGPYLDRGGRPMANGGATILLSAHGNIVGPGGQSIVGDSDGDLLVYHYYDANNNGIPSLGINYIGWTSDDWPYVY